MLLCLLCPHVTLAAQAAAHDRLSVQECALLQDGDLVLRAGQDIQSDMIRFYLGSRLPFCHVGIVRLDNGVPWIIHTLNGELTGVDGVQTQTLENWEQYAKPGTLFVVRPRWHDSTEAMLFMRYCVRMLEEQRPFDNGFDDSDNTSLYCTELVYDGLVQARFMEWTDLKTRVHGVIGFDGFLDVRVFTRLIDHPGLDRYYFY